MSLSLPVSTVLNSGIALELPAFTDTEHIWAMGWDITSVLRVKSREIVASKDAELNILGLILVVLLDQRAEVVQHVQIADVASTDPISAIVSHP